jgi:hypothetical protein
MRISFKIVIVCLAEDRKVFLRRNDFVDPEAFNSLGARVISPIETTLRAAGSRRYRVPNSRRYRQTISPQPLKAETHPCVMIGSILQSASSRLSRLTLLGEQSKFSTLPSRP